MNCIILNRKNQDFWVKWATVWIKIVRTRKLNEKCNKKLNWRISIEIEFKYKGILIIKFRINWKIAKF